MVKFIVIALALSLALISCSSSSQTAESSDEAKQEIYVFDDVDVSNSEIDSSSKVEEKTETIKNSDVFVVQVGAFTTKERAEEFVALKQSETNYPMSISFSSVVNLFVVQLPKFKSRAEAEQVRNELWATKKFEDAFILTVKE